VKKRETEQRLRGFNLPAKIKAIMVGLALMATIAVNLIVLGVGGYHFVRYVVMPRLNLVSDAEQWDESMRVATSAFRRLEEKDKALSQLIGLKEYAKILSATAKLTDAERLDDVVFMTDYPLELKFKASQVKAILSGVGAKPARRLHQRAITTMTTRSADATMLKRVVELANVTNKNLRDSSPERTRLLVRYFRAHPCDGELKAVVRKLLRREQLPAIERSFVSSIMVEKRRKCS